MWGGVSICGWGRWRLLARSAEEMRVIESEKEVGGEEGGDAQGDGGAFPNENKLYERSLNLTYTHNNAVMYGDRGKREIVMV